MTNLISFKIMQNLNRQKVGRGGGHGVSELPLVKSDSERRLLWVCFFVSIGRLQLLYLDNTDYKTHTE